MATLEALARRIEAEEPEILAVNVHAGFSFADTDETGVSFTVNTRGDGVVARLYLDELCRIALTTAAVPPEPEISVEEAIARLTEYKTGPILLVEPSDNIGAGAPGEGVTLLKALLEKDISGAGVIINDPEAVGAIAELPIGKRQTIEVGGKGSPLYAGGCTLEIELISRSDGHFTLEDQHSHMASMVGSQAEMGPCAVVRHGGITILLTSRPTPPFDLAQWRSQGIEPEKLAVIGIKAAVAHRRAYDPIARATIYVSTPGPCSSDFSSLPYRYVRRPVRPLDAL